MMLSNFNPGGNVARDAGNLSYIPDSGHSEVRRPVSGWKPLLLFGARRFVIGAVLVCAFSLVSILIGRSFTVAQEAQAKSLRHVVLFKFKDSSSKQDVQKIVDEFRALPKKISVIADFEYGVNNSPEGLNEGLTHCFLVTFKSDKDRDAYLPHAAHKEFVQLLMPHLEKAVVVDYFAGK